MSLGITIFIVITFLFGYLLGKYYGRKEGYHAAEVTQPILLRQQSFELGYCVLCNEKFSYSGYQGSHNNLKKGIELLL